MADTKISDLDALAYISGSYVFPVVDLATGATKKIQWNTSLLDSDDIIPACRAYNDANQAVANSTEVTLALNSEDFDTDGMHDLVTNNERITIQTDGKYLVSACFGFVNTFTAATQYNIVLNGSVAAQQRNSGSQNVVTVSVVLDLVATDYISLVLVQVSGSSQDARYIANHMCYLNVIRIGD